VRTSKAAYRAAAGLIEFAEGDTDAATLLMDRTEMADTTGGVLVLKGNARVAALRDFLIERKWLTPGKRPLAKKGGAR